MLEDKYDTNRTRAFRRKNDLKKAIRKKKISDRFLGKNSNGEQYHWYTNLHEYSKGKIHCSCPLCRRKTKSSHRGMSWEGSGKYDYKISELKQQQKLDNSLYEYLSENSRDANSEEQDYIDTYIKTISKSTGINFYNLIDKLNNIKDE